jgi:multidrug efflux system membrane fusion protein
MLALAGLCLPACSKPQPAADPRKDPAAVPVRVATALQQDVPIQIRSIARVEAYATVTVRPQVAGLLTSAEFTEGQTVKAGDLLYRVDARPFEAALRQVEATLAKDIALAKDARAEARRETDLYQQGAANQREYESALATADSLEAGVDADRALVERARLDLEYCSIRAPLSGRTGNRITDPGNVVKANETDLVVINQVNPIYVTFSVPEQNVPRIQKYSGAGRLAVDVTIDRSEGPTEHGELTFVDNKVDPATGMIELKGTLANEDHRLWPGQYVNATLTLTTESGAVVVPAQAVQTGQAGAYVFVVKPDRTVESRPIETGVAMDDKVVIARGLSAGETVVTDGQLRLVPGAQVAVQGEAPTTQKAAPTTQEAGKATQGSGS